MKIVIKIGSSLLASPGARLNVRRIQAIAGQVASLMERDGHEFVIVSSGAVAAGLKRMGLTTRPSALELRQASAAVGQSRLIWAYERSFRDFHRHVAQLLLTAEDIKNRTRYLNVRNTFQTLLERGIIPIVNENDVVSVDEIRFGDNDNLAALVAAMLGADMLLILSDVDGLYERDPRGFPDARIIHEVDAITPEIMALAGCHGGTCVGTGGMYSKLLAAQTARSRGVTVQIVGGKRKGIIARALDGKKVGTRFPAADHKMSSRKSWIMHGSRPRGTLVLDAGAVAAIAQRGKSLLPAGIVRVDGTFKKGDSVELAGPDGHPFARGLVNYPDEDLRKIQGKKANLIGTILGYTYADEVVHRDNMVLLGPAAAENRAL